MHKTRFPIRELRNVFMTLEGTHKTRFPIREPHICVHPNTPKCSPADLHMKVSLTYEWNGDIGNKTYLYAPGHYDLSLGPQDIDM